MSSLFFEHRHLNAGLEVRVGEVEDLLAVVGDRHAGDDAVDLVGLHGLQCGVEAERLDVDGEALVLGDGPDEVHVDADEIALLVLEFERGEGRVGGDGVVLALRRGGRRGQQSRYREALRGLLRPAPPTYAGIATRFCF